MCFYRLYFNTEKKRSGVNSFGKDVFKLMINSAYGKTMGNLRERINVRLVDNAKDYKKHVSKPSFVSQKLLNKDLVAIQEINPVLAIDKPIYAGFRVLDLSKFKMYDFHDNYTKKYDINAKLLFTDTECLTYEIEKEDVYEDFYKDKDLFDFSNYLEDSQFSDPFSMKEIGQMKDDFEGKNNYRVCWNF